MKRVHILLLLLVVLWWIIRWTSKDTPVVMIEQPQLLLPDATNPIWSWNDAWTGSIASGTGEAQSWAIDDTELPLDQNGQNMSWTQEATDPEVEEIIDLLEELIAESETEQ